MYKEQCPTDQEMDAQAKFEMEWVANNLLAIEAFQMYVKSKWMPKATTLVVGNHNLPYVGQNTNLTIENYHANLKNYFVIIQRQVSREIS